MMFLLEVNDEPWFGWEAVNLGVDVVSLQWVHH